MKCAFIGAGTVLCLVGLAVWVLPGHRVAQPNWIPLSAPISLVSNFSLRTNCDANTHGRYFAYVVFDTANLDLKDDTPEDTFNHPRRIPADIKLQVASHDGVLLETNVTNAVLGSEGAETVSYLLGNFDLKRQDKLAISFSNTPSVDSVSTGNPRLEIRLSAATYEDRLIAEAVGRRRGVPVAVFGFFLLMIGLLLPSNPLREKAK